MATGPILQGLFKNEEDDLDTANENIVMRMADGDGRVVRTANGLAFVSPTYSTTDPEEIERIIESQGSVNPAKEAPQRMRRQGLIQAGPIAAAVLKASQGIPFVGEFIPEAVGVVSPDARKKIETLQQATEEEAPLVSLGARVAGSAPAALLAPQVAGRTLLGQIGKGAGLTGAEATVSGFGAAEGEFLDRLPRAATEGSLGLFLGGLTSGIISAATRGTTSRRQLDRAIDQVAERLDISRGAALIITNAVRQGGSLEDALKALRRAGDSGMIADASLATQNLLDGMMTMGATGEAAAIGRQAVDTRAAQMSDELSETLDETLGEAPIGRKTLAETIQARTAPKRNRLYRQAYASPIDYTSAAGEQILKVVDRIPSRYMQTAIQNANDLMQAEGITARQIKATIADDGSVVFEEQPNVIQLDYIKKGLQRAARTTKGLYDEMTGKPKEFGLVLDRLATQLRGALGRAVPAYDQAVKIGGDTILEREAANMGAVIFRPNTTVEDVLLATTNASVDQLASMRLAARGQVQEMMLNAKNFISQGGQEGVTQARKIVLELGTAANRQKLSSILPPEDFDKLVKKLDEVRASLEVLASVAPNSKTAQRTEVAKTIDEILEPGILGSLTRLEPIKASQRFVQEVSGQADKLTEEERQKIFAEVARGLTEQRGRTAEAALQYLQKAMDGGTLSAAQASLLNRRVAQLQLPLIAESPTAFTNFMFGDN